MLVMYDIDLDEGMAMNQRALLIDPDNPMRIRLQGYYYYKLGEYEEALKILQHSDSLFVNWFDIENYLYLQEVEQALAKQRSDK